VRRGLRPDLTNKSRLGQSLVRELPPPSEVVCLAFPGAQ